MTSPPTVTPCRTCGGPTQANTQDGCTPYTCTTPCTVCDHPGDVHRDWYRDQYGAGFCRRCPEGHRHDFSTQEPPR
ncbi:hypothetical protein [Streptomyces sp. NPDC006267]|uniref:hypothetical protein n=1 Tax=Streptomyces sp. NPDC006267 TaxID=3157173 RepID=UPI0033B72AE4